MVKACLTLKETENQFPEWLWNFALPPLKINQWKHLAKWSREVRRGSLLLYHSRLIALSTRRKLILYYFTTQQEKERISPCLAISLPMTKLSLFSQWKPLRFSVAFQCPVYSHKLILTASLNSLLLSIKECFLLLVLWACLWFAIDLCISHCNSLLFLNKLFCL